MSKKLQTPSKNEATLVEVLDLEPITIKAAPLDLSLINIAPVDLSLFTLDLSKYKMAWDIEWTRLMDKWQSDYSVLPEERILATLNCLTDNPDLSKKILSYLDLFDFNQHDNLFLISSRLDACSLLGSLNDQSIATLHDLIETLD